MIMFTLKKIRGEKNIKKITYKVFPTLKVNDLKILLQYLSAIKLIL